MRRLLSVLALSLVSPALATTCSSLGFEWAAKRAELIVQAEVLRVVPSARPGITPPLYMDVKVLGTYLGKAPVTILRVRGDDGNSPYPYINTYPVGSRWILALGKRGFPKGERLPDNLYVPLDCTEQGLLVSGSFAYGVWSPMAGARVVPLKYLPARIREARARSEEEILKSRLW